MRLRDIENATLIWGVVSKEAIEKIKKSVPLVIIPEHRPFMTGLKYNCPRLRRENIAFVYCTDNALGLLFYKGAISNTMLFYKEKREEGVLGLSGSLYAALLSRLHNIPVEIMAQGNCSPDAFMDDVSVLGGKKFIFEENKSDCIVAPEDEFINWEHLK